MRYRYKLNPAMLSDYEEAYAWYEDRQMGLGERFTEAVRQKLEEISLNPEIFGKTNSRIFREASLDNFPYLIVYKISKRRNEIYISSIHHTMKHPGKKYRK